MLEVEGSFVSIPSREWSLLRRSSCKFERRSKVSIPSREWSLLRPIVDID